MARFSSKTSDDRLKRLKLNQLLILDALLETRQVTLAGTRLGLTQPATSAALSKLRSVFGDDLLVAVGREFQLTPKAEALRGPVRHLIETVETIFKVEEFSPKGLKGEFSIATADYMSIVLLPHLIESVLEPAPELTLRFTNLNRDSCNRLKCGDIDMIIAPAQLIRDPNIVSRHIFDDRLVCVYRCEAGEPKRAVDLEQYLASGHVATVVDSTEPVTRFDTSVKEIDNLRARQRNVAVVPYYAALPLIAATSSLLTLVQERLVGKFLDHLPIAYTDPPVPLPAFHYAMFWSPRLNQEPGHRWVRDAIAETCRRVFPRQQGAC